MSCSSVTEKSFMPFVTIIFKHSHEPIFLDFFKAIIKPNSVILKSNQNLVLKLLVGLPKVMAVLGKEIELRFSYLKTRRHVAGDPGGGGVGVGGGGGLGESDGEGDGGERGKGSSLLRMSDSVKPGIRQVKGTFLRPHSRTIFKSTLTARGSPCNDEHSMMEDYKIGLISLLGLCAEGKNYFTETTCQKLLSFEECVRVCVDSTDKTFYLTKAYGFFAMEVFLNTESANTTLVNQQGNENLWILLYYFSQAIMASVMNQVELQAPLYEDYIFNVILPFVQYFYTKHFNLARVESTQSPVDALVHSSSKTSSLKEESKQRRKFSRVPSQNKKTKKKIAKKKRQRRQRQQQRNIVTFTCMGKLYYHRLISPIN